VAVIDTRTLNAYSSSGKAARLPTLWGGMAFQCHIPFHPGCVSEQTGQPILANATWFSLWRRPARIVGQPILAAAGFLAGSRRDGRLATPRKSRLKRRLRAKLPPTTYADCPRRKKHVALDGILRARAATARVAAVFCGGLVATCHNRDMEISSHGLARIPTARLPCRRPPFRPHSAPPRDPVPRRCGWGVLPALMPPGLCWHFFSAAHSAGS